MSAAPEARATARGEEQRCTACAAWLPRDRDHFRPAPPGARAPFVGPCHACERARRCGARGDRNGMRRCAGYCGLVKPATTQHFYARRERGYAYLTRWCRVCYRARLRNEHRGARRRAWWARYRDSGRASEAVRRYRATHPRKRSKLPIGYVRARNRLAQAVRSGRLAKPTTCPTCGSGRKLMGVWNRGPEHPLDVTWRCFVCEADRRRRAAQAARRSEDRSGALAVEPAEFDRLYRVQLARLERERAELARFDPPATADRAVTLKARRARFLASCYLDVDPALRAGLVLDRLEVEGWTEGRTPLEPVLGVWVPTLEPEPAEDAA